MRIVSRKNDLTGVTFGRLRVVGYSQRKNYLLCACSCGNEREIHRSNILGGRTVSCGCRKLETGKENRTHGKSKGREYQIWIHIKSRCGRGSCKDYPNYGGRGIKLCDRWKLFENFLADMGECPDGFSIDRIDPNGNYEPGNCRWATRKQQNRNRRNTKIVTFNGEAISLGELAERVGINYRTLVSRLSAGWALDAALSTPVAKRGDNHARM